MALIECSECHGKVSDKAEKCPHCGAPAAATGESPNASGSDSSPALPTRQASASTPTRKQSPTLRGLQWAFFAVVGVTIAVGATLTIRKVLGQPRTAIDICHRLEVAAGVSGCKEGGFSDDGSSSRAEAKVGAYREGVQALVFISVYPTEQAYLKQLRLTQAKVAEGELLSDTGLVHLVANPDRLIIVSVGPYAPADTKKQALDEVVHGL